MNWETWRSEALTDECCSWKHAQREVTAKLELRGNRSHEKQKVYSGRNKSYTREDENKPLPFLLIFTSLSVQPKLRPCISGSLSSLSFPQWWVQELRSKPDWTWHSPRHRDWLRNEPVTPTGCKGARSWEHVEKKFSHFQKRVYKRDAFLPVDAGCPDVTPRTVTTRVASLTVK